MALGPITASFKTYVKCTSRPAHRCRRHSVLYSTTDGYSTLPFRSKPREWPRNRAREGRSPLKTCATDLKAFPRCRSRNLVALYRLCTSPRRIMKAADGFRFIRSRAESTSKPPNISQHIRTSRRKSSGSRSNHECVESQHLGTAMNTPDSNQTGDRLLVLKDVQVVYNRIIQVLHGVSLVAKPGAITALLGGNGAGKTTTLKAISCLLKSERGEMTRGSITWGGVEISHAMPHELVEQGIVEVFEGRRVF